MRKSVGKSPSPGTGEMVAVRIRPLLLAMIDRWRERQMDSPSRPEALRRLAVQALTGEGKKATATKSAVAKKRP